jgi:hypothetical protein
LTDAKEQRNDSLEVLPELKISTHSYTIFVFNKILLNGRDTFENVLSALKRANHSEFLSALGNLEQGNYENPEDVINALKAEGIRYIDEFLSSGSKRSKEMNPPQLVRFLSEINGKGGFQSPEDHFNSLANNLMNNLCLVVGTTAYRIVECEMYYMDPEHQDPYVHCGDQQLTAGQLYLNRVGGLDITFGNPDRPAWGGILIRGIRNMRTDEYISKVTEITTEIFKALGNIITQEKGIYLAELEPEQVRWEQPFKSVRIGLSKKKNDTDGFIDRPYRYLVEFVREHKFRDKEKVVRELIREKGISADEAKNILGYNIKMP